MRVAWCVFAVAIACDPTPSKTAAPAARKQSAQLVGISPAEFQCSSLISIDAMAQLMGAPVRQVDTSMPTQTGLAAPCSYLVAAAEPQAWTFDIDCRDGMKARADELFVQYKRISEEMVALAASEHAPAPDGGRPRHPPQLARDVAVGSRGLDHRGQGLLFIDDNAPCYVRVVGADAEHRLALARHLANALTPATAPMTPRLATP
jgi:hypothetical protein